MCYFSKKEWIILLVLFAFSFVPVVGGVLRIIEIGGGPAVAPINPRISANPLPALLHLLGVIPYCTLGAFQFLPSIRQHAPKWHRFNGWIVIFSGILSAISGLWMTHVYAFPIELQGSFLYVVRMLIGSAMTVSIVLGLTAIISGHVFLHGARMLRAYAIGQGAATQTLMGLTWIVLFGEESTGLTRDMMMTLAWVINLIVAEWIIRKSGERLNPAREKN